MIKAVIIEDEAIHLENLREQLKAICPEVNIVAEITSAPQAIKCIPNLSFDLLFLNAQLKEMNAFNLLQKLSVHNFHVIFISANNESAIKAFKINAVDYIIKPIMAQELRIAVSKAMKLIFSAKVKDKLLLDYSFPKNQNLIIPDKQTYTFIPIKDILYCHARSNYTDIYLRDMADNGNTPNRVVISTKNLAYYETRLFAYGFIRIHNSYLVNKNKMRKINHHTFKITLEEGTELPISRRLWDHLMKELEN